MEQVDQILVGIFIAMAVIVAPFIILDAIVMAFGLFVFVPCVGAMWLVDKVTRGARSLWSWLQRIQ